MNIKEYIASGILEQYALDLLSDDERRSVEKVLLQYPELKKELSSIEDALYLYSLSKTKTPPQGLEKQILEKIKSEGKADDAPTPGPSKPNYLWWIAGFGILLSFALWQFFQKSSISSDLMTLQNEYENLAADCDTVRSERDLLIEQLQFVRNSNSQDIQMKGTDLMPQGIATIYYNPEEQKTLLDINNLPVPSSDRQYQLWVIVDGVPQDMGVFDLFTTEDALKEVPYFANAAAFAVTLEPVGGSESPTLDQMVVYGEVQG